MKSITRFIKSLVVKLYPDLKGVFFSKPGDYYSPLIKISEIDASDNILQFDGLDYWEHVNLRHENQVEFFKQLLPIYEELSFNEEKCSGHNYYSNNTFFNLSDAFLLAAMIDHAKPQRIVEIGSGFSSGVIVDTIKRLKIDTKLTFIEPNPERLHEVLKGESCEHKIIDDIVQRCDLEIFEEMEEDDIFFVDSSHVAKAGSDVTHIFLRILPRLRRGVLVHIHDTVYPETYPLEWIKMGIAWNESLFLRCFLQYNDDFQIVAFNQYAWKQFPEVFQQSGIDFRKRPGGSFWMKRM